MSHRYREFRGQKTGDELRMERLKRMSETNALVRRRAKEAARALARNPDMVKALHAWTAFCDKMAAWKRAALADDPVAWGKDLEGTVASVQRIIDMKVLNPPRLAAEAVAVQKNPQAFVIQEMRKWTSAQVQTLYPHLAALQDNYRLDDLSQRALAVTLVEAAFSRATKFMLINVSIHPFLLRQNIWDAKTMLDCVLPSWSTAIVPGPTTLDPYLGLRRLRGPVTYTYLEPKPEWKARVPHLPIIILLGDHHAPKPPCVGFDVTDDGTTKEVGRAARETQIRWQACVNAGNAKRGLWRAHSLLRAVAMLEYCGGCTGPCLFCSAWAQSYCGRVGLLGWPAWPTWPLSTIK